MPPSRPFEFFDLTGSDSEVSDREDLVRFSFDNGRSLRLFN